MLNFLLKLFSTKYQLQLNQVFQAINFCNSKLIFAAAADLLRHCPNFLYYVGTNCPQLESLTPWHQEVQNRAGESQYFKPGSNRLFIAELETNLRVVWSSFTIMEKAPT